jgi:hypothetical protein
MCDEEEIQTEVEPSVFVPPLAGDLLTDKPKPDSGKTWTSLTEPTGQEKQ